MSEVWNNFVRSEQDVERCICNYCGDSVKCTIATGSSAMTKHTRWCKEYSSSSAISSQTQTRLASDGKESGSLVAWAFNQDKCRRAYVMMVILDELPFSFVDNLGFRLFLSEACPSFAIPSRFTIARDVMDMFTSEKALLKSILSRQRVSFTTDLWTSITTVSYMVITAHFVDENWQLNRRIIGFSPVSNHKGITIAKKLETCLLDWEIKKICTLSVDNASANDCAVRIFRNKLMNWEVDALVLDGDFMHVRCCAHILNLIVKDGLSKKGNCVAGVRNTVKYIRSSSSRLDAFRKKQDEVEIKRGNLILDCGIRWNSTYLMLDASLKFRKAFGRMAEEDKLYADHFEKEDIVTKVKRVGSTSLEDWDNAERIIKFLKIFYDCTLIFSASKRVTYSGCYNGICKISKSLQYMAVNHDLSWSTMGNFMLEKFDKYWEGAEKINKIIIIVACVLDPHKKLGFVMHCLEKIHGKGNPKCTEIKDEVFDLLKRLYEVYHAEYKLISGGAAGNKDMFFDGSKDVADLIDSDEEDDPFKE